MKSNIVGWSQPDVEILCELRSIVEFIEKSTVDLELPNREKSKVVHDPQSRFHIDVITPGDRLLMNVWGAGISIKNEKIPFYLQIFIFIFT